MEMQVEMALLAEYPRFEKVKGALSDHLAVPSPQNNTGTRKDRRSSEKSQ
jgi:hypothetical protein